MFFLFFSFYFFYCYFFLFIAYFFFVCVLGFFVVLYISIFASGARAAGEEPEFDSFHSAGWVVFINSLVSVVCFRCRCSATSFFAYPVSVFVDDSSSKIPLSPLAASECSLVFPFESRLYLSGTRFLSFFMSYYI
jgi:hypothetical protein